MKCTGEGLIIGTIVPGLDVESQTMLTHNYIHIMVIRKWKERNITIWDLKRNIKSVPHCYVR